MNTERRNELKAVYVSGGAKALIDYTSGSHDTDVWALAMVEQYGPVGLHESRFGRDHRPDPEKCVDCPRVFEAIEDAAKRLRARLEVEV